MLDAPLSSNGKSHFASVDLTANEKKAAAARLTEKSVHPGHYCQFASAESRNARRGEP